MEPAQKECAQGCPVSEDEEGVDSVLFIVSVYRAHELMNPYSDVKRAFSHRQSCIEFPEIVSLTHVFRVFNGIQLSPVLLGNGIKQAELLLCERYILSYIAYAEVFVELIAGLSRSCVRASPYTRLRQIDAVLAAIFCEPLSVFPRLFFSLFGQLDEMIR